MYLAERVAIYFYKLFAIRFCLLLSEESFHIFSSEFNNIEKISFLIVIPKERIVKEMRPHVELRILDDLKIMDCGIFLRIVH